MSFSIALFLIAAWFLGGCIGGITGMGIAFIAMPIAACVLELNVAILSCCLICFVACLGLSLIFHKHCLWKELWPLVFACVPGTFAGVWILKIAPLPVLQLGLGTIMIMFVAWQLFSFRLRYTLPGNVLYALMTGFSGGFVNGSVGLGGGPLGIYVTLRRWDKDAARGTMGNYFAITTAFTVIMQLAAGLYTPIVLEASLYGCIGVIAGLLVSIPLARRIQQDGFRKLILASIALAGAVLLLRALQ